MTALRDLAAHVRSKNAGPFWLTVDFVFEDRARFDIAAASPALAAAPIAALYGVDPAVVQRYEAPDILTIKISFPRKIPQGGMLERDMHGGQAYARLLDLEI